MSYYEKYTIGFWASTTLAIMFLILFFLYLYFVPVSIDFEKSPSSLIPTIKEINGLIPRVLLPGLAGCFASLARVFYKAKEKYL